MNWKEFFKPNKWKIIFTIIIFVLFLLLAFPRIDKSYPEFCLVEEPCEPAAVTIVFMGSYINVTNYSENIRNVIWFSLILLEIILSYLISCLLIYIYKKLKK